MSNYYIGYRQNLGKTATIIPVFKDEKLIAIGNVETGLFSQVDGNAADGMLAFIALERDCGNIVWTKYKLEES